MSHNDTMPPARAEHDELVWSLDCLETPIALLDEGGSVRFANAAARALAVRLSPSGDTAALVRALPAEAFEQARRSGAWRGELVLPSGAPLQATLRCSAATAGRRCLLSLRSSPAQDGDLLAPELLLHSEKMASIGQLAAGVAHEINNPIGYVHSNLGTLQEYVANLFVLLDAYAEAMRAEDPRVQRPRLQALRERLDLDFISRDLPQLLAESREGIERVTKIVRDLKEFSYSGRDEVMRPVDLHRGLDSTLNIVWNDLKYKVTLEKQYGELPPVECLPSELNQVFMNLLLNAGQAIAERGTIVLATGCDGDEAWVAVTDSGCGIPEDALARIFDPFYTTKPVGRGTGLGLAIAYNIVARHHGRIEVTSRVGEGSTFRVVLPVRQPRTEAAQ